VSVLRGPTEHQRRRLVPMLELTAR
jgi:hypothetical protein